MVKRGDICFVNLEPTMGSEQGKVRPAVIISHNSLNTYSEHVIAVPITSKKYEKHYEMHVKLTQADSIQEGTIKVEHIRSLSKKRIGKHVGVVSEMTLENIGRALQYTCDYI